MEKHSLVKNTSFGENGDVGSPRSPHTITCSEVSDQNSRHDSADRGNMEDEASIDDHGHNLDKVLEEIDQFTNVISTIDDRSCPPEVPDAVETFSKIIESRITKYNSGEAGNKFGKMTEDDAFFLEAVMRISKLTNAFSEFPSNSSTSPSLNRTSLVCQRAMTFLEEQFRIFLEDSGQNSSANTSKALKNASFSSSRQEETDRCLLEKPESREENDFPGYSSEVVTTMKRIASTMISAGYETECCQAYWIIRRNAFNEQMKKLEFEKLNMDDLHRMSWESLEGEISRWIKVVKACSNSLFPGERQLGEEVFSDSPLISRRIFGNHARAVVIQLLDFAEGVSMAKRSAEKLFKFLDVYEAIRELIPAISESCPDDCEHELRTEISAAGQLISDTAVNIFTDLETSIKTDASKTPVPGGAVHPLTRYVMNYLKYACEYKETLEQIFQEHSKAKFESSNNEEIESKSPENHETVASMTPFSVQLVTIMDLLDSNLEAKSMLYRDPSLRYIFLMNNGRYILQKVKGSSEIHKLVGDNWYRRRSTIVRQYHKNYQRETWIKLLQILSHEGLQVNGKVNKQILKDRFKAFTLMFEEIHRTQCTWVVSDEQLQTELRVSISAVVIPAYRSFVGRFRQYLEYSKQVEKYIKYQPEDIESLIEELFDGNPTSMARRR